MYNHENDVPSRLSPQWLCGNSCTWAHDVRFSCAQVHELPQSHCGDNREGTLFSWLHIYYAHLASVRFEHSVCRGSLMAAYIYTHTHTHTTQVNFSGFHAFDNNKNIIPLF